MACSVCLAGAAEAVIRVEGDVTLDYPNDDPVADSARMNRWIESDIRRNTSRLVVASRPGRGASRRCIEARARCPRDTSTLRYFGPPWRLTQAVRPPPRAMHHPARNLRDAAVRGKPSRGAL